MASGASCKECAAIGVGVLVPALKNKSQIPKAKQITMTEIQNAKQLAFDLICDLVLVICYFRFIQVRQLKFRFWH